MTTSLTLDVEWVRLVATQSGLREIYFNPESRLISFVSKKEPIYTIQQPRINVYYSTGTVGTCLDHPQRGKTQLFRRNVNLELLQRLMREPRLHTGQGYYRRTSSQPMPASNSTTQTLTEEAEADLEIKRLREHATKIAKLLAEATAVKEACKKRREDEAQRKAAEFQKTVALRFATQLKAEIERKKEELAVERYARGTSCAYILNIRCRKHANECFDSSVVSVATNGDAIIFLHDDGTQTWTPGLPTELYNKLNGRSHSPHKLPSPVYVSMGTQSRYYIRFADGHHQWFGPAGLHATLKSTNKAVITVAFGERWNSYFVVFEDGDWICNDIPDELFDLLERRELRSDLACVSLGPDGQYFLEAKNRKMWWGGLTKYHLDYIDQHENSITFMDFGGDDALFLRYNEC